MTSPSVSPRESFPQSVIAPLAPERYRIQFAAPRQVHDKLRRAQDLLRHTIPDGDVAAVFDRALTLLVEELERRKLATAARPRPPQSLTSHSRYVPAAVKRIVWARNGGQCTFVGTQGRCTEPGSSRSITWCRSPPVARRPPGISRFDAARTTATRQNSSRSAASRAKGRDRAMPPTQR